MSGLRRFFGANFGSCSGRVLEFCVFAAAPGRCRWRRLRLRLVDPTAGAGTLCPTVLQFGARRRVRASIKGGRCPDRIIEKKGRRKMIETRENDLAPDTTAGSEVLHENQQEPGSTVPFAEMPSLDVHLPVRFGGTIAEPAAAPAPHEKRIISSRDPSLHRKNSTTGATTFRATSDKKCGTHLCPTHHWLRQKISARPTRPSTTEMPFAMTRSADR